ncbi:MAG TPA: hypothetical protein PLG94_16155 [Smithellaceae bacterium]|nr:hypothetical protein [Smithellaceae bacterium]
MINVFKVIFIIVLVLLAFGCTPVYRIQVNGYADPDQIGKITQKANIHVIENTKAENPLLDKEIRTKIEKILKNRGLILSNIETADLLCKFNYGMGMGLTRIGSIPVQSPPVTTSVIVSNQSGAAQTTTLMTPGPTSYMPYARTEYDRWLNIVVLDARSFRESKTDKVIWYGEIISSGSSRDLRTVMNYMLIVVLEEFGKDTKKGIIIEIKENDERLKSFADD